MSEEIWKDIAGYEGKYQVSNMGRVKSLPRWHRKTEKILNPGHDKLGYVRAALSHGKKVDTRSVHRLVAEAFIPNPFGLPEVNHKDENPSNNHVDNLEWCTTEYNMNYGTRTARASLAESVPVLQFSLDGDFIREWNSVTEVRRHFGGKQGSGIRQCCDGTCNMAYGYTWRWRRDFDEIPAHIDFHYVPAKIPEKPVLQYTLNGEFVKEYPSALAAAKENGYSRGNICNVCRGNKPYMYGYIWRYKGSNIAVRPVVPIVKFHRRAVLQFSLEGRLLNEFESAPDAERKTGIRHEKIFRCCNGGRKSSGGYRWAFKDIYEEKRAG